MPSHLKTNMNIYIWMIANLHRVEPKHIAGDESCCLAPITTVLFCHHICYRLNQYTWTCGTHTIEERWKQKARQRSWRRVVGKICSIPYHASFCASVYMEETIEFNSFLKIVQDKKASAARNWTNFVPPTDATTFALPSVSILLLWLEHSIYSTVPKAFCDLAFFLEI